MLKFLIISISFACIIQPCCKKKKKAKVPVPVESIATNPNRSVMGRRIERSSNFTVQEMEIIRRELKRNGIDIIE